MCNTLSATPKEATPIRTIPIVQHLYAPRADPSSESLADPVNKRPYPPHLLTIVDRPVDDSR